MNEMARNSDPDTSAMAAVKINATHLRAAFVAGVKRCGGSCTAKEAAYAMTDNPERAESIRKRAKECVDRGFVKSRGGIRRCSVTGNLCTVYYL